MTKQQELAEEHWRFLEKWLHLVFVDGFVHGFKHGMWAEQVESAHQLLMENSKVRNERKQTKPEEST